MTDDEEKRLAALRSTRDWPYWRSVDNLNFLLRLLDEALAAREWRPIETAPKDGTPVDLLQRFEPSGKRRRLTDCLWATPDVAKPSVWLDAEGDAIEWGPDQYGQSSIVTHWMPLPEPPK